MSLKSANVTARVEPEVKEQAEAILQRMGLSASTGINLFYRQIIVSNGLPFRPAVSSGPTAGQLRARLTQGLAEAKAGEGVPAGEFFAALREEILNENA